jgi:hypothetical protein
MSMGVVESLLFERAEEGEDLFFISGGGMEDMVVEGREGWGVRTSRLGFLNDQVVFVGDDEPGMGSPTFDHVPPQPPRS